MGHKDYKRINAWLADLRNNNYVEWIYSTDFLEKSKPGIYYLGINGIRWLKSYRDYPIQELRKRYRESSRSLGFINQCMLLADCCIKMDKISAEHARSGQLDFVYETYTDLQDPDSDCHFLAESELIRPQLLFEKTVEDKGDYTYTTHLLEIIEATMPRYRVRKRIKNYIEFLEDGYFQEGIYEQAPNPIIMLVCPTLADLIYCKRATKRLLVDKWYEDITFWFTTAEKLKTHGINGMIWEVVTVPKDDRDDDDDDDEDDEEENEEEEEDDDY